MYIYSIFTFVIWQNVSYLFVVIWYVFQAVEYYHMKMMIVGYGGRGKSTMLRGLIKQKQPEKCLPTVGVVVKDWKWVIESFEDSIFSKYILSYECISLQIPMFIRQLTLVFTLQIR